MLYNFNNKNIHIPTQDLEKSIRILGLSEEEAIQMWLEDNEFLINAEVEKLTQKAKTNKINHGAKSDKPRKNAPRVRKPDEEKENLIKILANCLENSGFEVKIINKSKIIEFNVGENHYKLDLIKQRPPKNT